MRVSVAVTAVAVLALSACQEAPQAGADAASEPPASGADPAVETRPAEAQVREGLWRTVMTVEGQTLESRACMDAATSPLSTASTQATTGDCEHSVEPAGDGWRFTSRCALPTGGETSTEGVMTGDLQTAYRVEATTTTSGAPLASMNRTVAMTTEATHEGACPEGWSPGDIEIAGLARMNLADMQARAEEMASR